MKKRLGERIRVLRKQAALSQEVLAEASNMTAASIGLLERGEVWPRMETLEAIAARLGVTPVAFFDEVRADDTFSKERRKLIELARTVDEAHVSTLLAAFEGFLGPLALLSEHRREPK
jgi:transcriptional regulator with XRE-family HTH domain